MKRTLFLILASFTMLSGCSDKEDVATATPTATSTPAPSPSPTPSDIGKLFDLSQDIKMVIASDGTGTLPVAGDRVFFTYSIETPDGDLVDSQMDVQSPMSVLVGENSNWEIWQEALLNLKEGSEATLNVPKDSLEMFGIDLTDDMLKIKIKRVSEPEL